MSVMIIRKFAVKSVDRQQFIDLISEYFYTKLKTETCMGVLQELSTSINDYNQANSFGINRIGHEIYGKSVNEIDVLQNIIKNCTNNIDCVKRQLDCTVKTNEKECFTKKDDNGFNECYFTRTHPNPKVPDIGYCSSSLLNYPIDLNLKDIKYIIGLTYYSVLTGYNKMIHLCGEFHKNIDYNLINLNKNILPENSIDIHDYLLSLAPSYPDKNFDIFLETKYKTLESPNYRYSGTSHMGKFTQVIQDCLLRDKRKCKYTEKYPNIKFHYVDYRHTENSYFDILTTKISTAKSNERADILSYFDIPFETLFSEIIFKYTKISKNLNAITDESLRMLIYNYFKSHLFELYTKGKDEHEEQWATNLQDFCAMCVDFYTVSRMFRSFLNIDGSIYTPTNIYYYCGQGHAIHVFNLLRYLEFQVLIENVVQDRCNQNPDFFVKVQ